MVLYSEGEPGDQGGKDIHSLLVLIRGEPEGVTPLSIDIGSSISDSLIIEYLAEREDLGKDSAQASVDRLKDLVLEVEYVLKQNQILLGAEPTEPSESQELTIICDDSSGEILQNVVVGLRDLLSSPLLGALGQRQVLASLDRQAAILQRLVLFLQRRDNPALSDRDYHGIVVEVTASSLADLSAVSSYLNKLGKRIDRFVAKHLQEEDLVTSVGLDLSGGELVLSSRSGIEADSLSVNSSRSSLGAELQELRKLKESAQSRKINSLRSPLETLEAKPSNASQRGPDPSSPSADPTQLPKSLEEMDEIPDEVGRFQEIVSPRTSGAIRRSIEKDVDKVLDRGNLLSRGSSPLKHRLSKRETALESLIPLEKLSSDLTELRSLVKSAIEAGNKEFISKISQKIDEIAVAWRPSSTVSITAETASPNNAPGDSASKPGVDEDPNHDVSYVFDDNQIKRSTSGDPSAQQNVDSKDLFQQSPGSLRLDVNRSPALNGLVIIFSHRAWRKMVHRFSLWRRKTLLIAQKSESFKCGFHRINLLIKKRNTCIMLRRFQQWERINIRSRFEAMYQSLVRNMSNRVDMLEKSVVPRISTNVLAKEAVVALNKELNVVKEEQYRVIEEYQRRLLHLESDDKRPSSRAEFAKQILLSREKEIINARAEVHILKEELQLLYKRIHHVALDTFREARAGLASFRISSDVHSKEHATRIIIGELRRLKNANAELDQQVKFLESQVYVNCIFLASLIVFYL